MDTEARRSRFVLPLLAGLFAIAAAFAGSASISDWSAATRVAPVDPKALPGLAADDTAAKANAALPTDEDAPRVPLPGADVVRTKVRCAGCGVVESVRRIDRQEIAAGGCSFADFDRLGITANARDGGEYARVATLAGTVDDALAGRPCAKEMKVTSSYQIVVRFRDGSRRVFNEATARALQFGDRVLVIAGANLPSR